jgi:hypothetical protein
MLVRTYTLQQDMHSTGYRFGTTPGCIKTVTLMQTVLRGMNPQVVGSDH